MTASNHRLLIGLVALLFVFGTALRMSAQTPHPVKWTFAASMQGSVPLQKGATIIAHVHASIEHGWHLYAPDQEPGGPTGVRITLPNRQPFAIHGDIDAPAPKTAIDPNLNVETRFYEDSVTFTVPLKVTSRSTNGIRKISVDVLYQACDQVMCLEPTVSHLESPLNR